jgi:hypothetical protein
LPIHRLAQHCNLLLPNLIRASFQAEQLLKALMNQEKKLQDKRKQKQEDAGKTSVDKDW